MIGKRQKASLEEVAARLAQAKADDPAKLVIKVKSWRRYPRELGGGAGHPVVLCYVYDDGNHTDGTYDMGLFSSEKAAIDKGREVALYLCNKLGVSRDAIKLVRAR